MKGFKPAHYACLLLCMVWACYMTSSKYVLKDGFVSTTGVTLIQRASIVLWLLIPFLRLPRDKRRLGRRHVLPLLAIATNLVALTYLTYWAYGKYNQGVANSAVLSRSDIVFAIVMGRILLNERVRFWEYVAMAGMVCGVFLITKVSLTRIEFHWQGDVSIVAAALMLTCNAFIIRLFLPTVHNTTLTVYNSAVCSLILSGIYLWLEVSQGTAARDAAAFLAHPNLLAGNLILGILGTVQFLLYYHCLHAMPVWELRAFLLFIPFFAAPIAWFFVGDTIATGQVAGMIVVTVFGFWLMLLSRARGQAEADGLKVEAEGSQV